VAGGIVFAAAFVFIYVASKIPTHCTRLLFGPDMIGLAKSINIYRVGQNHVHTVLTYSTFGRDITKFTVIYSVHIRFCPPLVCIHIYTVKCPYIWTFSS
jgi:hypothetical protein